MFQRIRRGTEQHGLHFHLTAYVSRAPLLALYMLEYNPGLLIIGSYQMHGNSYAAYDVLPCSVLCGTIFMVPACSWKIE